MAHSAAAALLSRTPSFLSYNLTLSSASLVRVLHNEDVIHH